MKTEFTHLEFIAFILEGLLLLTLLELFFGLSGMVPDKLPTNIDAILENQAIVLLGVLAIAYTLGHVNSMLAHWWLQEWLTARRFGRPSSHLIHGKRERFFRFYCRLPDPSWRDLRYKSLELRPYVEGYDRRVFAGAFRFANTSEAFDNIRGRLMLNFNFSRNMSCALILGCFLFGLALGISAQEKVQPDVPSLWVSVVENPGRTAVFGAFYIIISFLMSWRFLYFLRTYTKEILVHYVEHYNPMTYAKLPTDWSDRELSVREHLNDVLQGTSWAAQNKQGESAHSIVKCLTGDCDALVKALSAYRKALDEGLLPQELEAQTRKVILGKCPTLSDKDVSEVLAILNQIAIAARDSAALKRTTGEQAGHHARAAKNQTQ